MKVGRAISNFTRTRVNQNIPSKLGCMITLSKTLSQMGFKFTLLKDFIGNTVLACVSHTHTNTLEGSRASPHDQTLYFCSKYMNIHKRDKQILQVKFCQPMISEKYLFSEKFFSNCGKGLWSCTKSFKYFPYCGRGASCPTLKLLPFFDSR